jgi:hypothetical protein
MGISKSFGAADVYSGEVVYSVFEISMPMATA